MSDSQPVSDRLKRLWVWALVWGPAWIIVFATVGPRAAGLVGIVAVVGGLILFLLPTQKERAWRRFSRLSEEEAELAMEYEGRCPRCGREGLRDMETDQRVFPENAYEFAGRRVYCGKCY